VFYLGADSEREDREGLAHRQLGVTNSADGVTWERCARNPVWAHNPNAPLADEEGVFSTVATAPYTGLLVFYGALTNLPERPGQVNGDVRALLRHAEFQFRDLGIILSHEETDVWGHGDELYPLAATECDGRWYLLYLANGAKNGADWDVGPARGTSPTQLDDIRELVSAKDHIVGLSLGPTNVPGEYWVLLKLTPDHENLHFKLYRLSFTEEPAMTRRLRFYQFPDTDTSTVYHDRDVGT
jgi:hypothetical protein